MSTKTKKAPAHAPDEVVASPSVLAGEFMTMPPRVEDKAKPSGPPIGSRLTTFRGLEFFPEHKDAKSYVGVRLAGEPFYAPAGTPATVVDHMNGRMLIKVSSPKVGYRFTLRDEFVAEGETAPPASRRAAESEPVAAG